MKQDGVHSQCVYEIVPMRDTDEMHRRLAQDQSADSTSKVLDSIMVSVGEFVKKQSEIIEIETLRHQQSIHQGTMERLIYT